MSSVPPQQPDSSSSSNQRNSNHQSGHDLGANDEDMDIIEMSTQDQQPLDVGSLSQSQLEYMNRIQGLLFGLSRGDNGDVSAPSFLGNVSTRHPLTDMIMSAIDTNGDYMPDLETMPSMEQRTNVPSSALSMAAGGIENAAASMFMTAAGAHRLIPTIEETPSNSFSITISSQGFQPVFGSSPNSQHRRLADFEAGTADSPSGSNSRSSIAVDAVEARYLQQLLFGCGTENCENSFCASNPAFSLSGVSDMRHVARTLSRMGPQNLCPSFSSALNSLRTATQTRKQSTESDATLAMAEDTEFVPLKFEMIKLQVDAARQSSDFNAVTKLIYPTFSSLPRLMKAFRVGPGIGRLSITEVNQSYDLLMQCPSSVTSCIITAISCLLDKVKLGRDRFQEIHLDALFILMNNPLLMDSSYHNSTLVRINELLVSLLETSAEVVAKKWLEFVTQVGYEEIESSIHRLPSLKDFLTSELQRIVAVFQHLVTMRIYTMVSQMGSSASPNKDEAVANATRCLSIFYLLNEKFDLVPFEEFYNEAVNEHMDIKDDFPRWKAKEGFSFCNYPFMLNSSTKSDILKVESMVQMRHELQDAFFRAIFIGVNSPYLVLEIRREHIIRDALYQLESKKPQDLKKQLKVQFVGEEGVDEGGVQKEFFQLVVRELFDLKYGIFKQNDESHLYWFTHNPLQDDASIEELRLVGRLTGLAIFNGVILDFHFPLALYKKLMNVRVSFKDLEAYDPMLFRNFKTLLEFDGDVESTFDRTFQIEFEQFGSHFTYDLKPNGSQIPLNNDNRKEFVELYTDYILNQSIEKQFKAFQEGFNMVCAGSAISIFRPEEMEQLVCGSEDLDFETLKQSTSYDGGYEESTPIILYFWEVVLNFSNEQKKKLLFFATGTDRVPIGGLAKLNFVIAKSGPDSDRLPSSHTCFNVLLLPEYSSKEKLESRLLTAIQNSEGFGMI